MSTLRVPLLLITAALLSCGNPRRDETTRERFQSDAPLLQLIERCQQMGDRLVKSLREMDANIDIPEVNQHYTHRSHYNTVERKCLVQTDGEISPPFVGTFMMSQIIDVNNGAGGPAIAERDIPMSGEPMKLYRGKQALPTTPQNLAWFDNLMTK